MNKPYKRPCPVRKQPIPEKLVGKVFIDPKYDTGFQEFFNSEDALKDFLDGLLDLHGDDKIKSLEYAFNYATRFRVPQSRKIIMDIFATTGSGRMLDIEMQRAEHGFFIDRTVLYKAFMIIKSKQKMEESKEFLALSKDEKEYRRYELPETISIWICDFDMPEFCKDYIDEWSIYSRNSLRNGIRETIFPKNKYIMVSLPNFNKTPQEVESPTDVWLYLLKHAGTGEELPNFGSSIVDEALERIRIDNLDDATLQTLEKDMIAQEEIDCRLAGARIETRLEMVDAMLARNYSDDEISLISGLSKEEIAKRRTAR